MARPSSGPTFEILHLLGVLGTEGLAMVMGGSFGSSDEYVYYEALLDMDKIRFPKTYCSNAN